MELTGEREEMEKLMNSWAEKGLKEYLLSSHSELNEYFVYLRKALDIQLFGMKSDSLNLTVRCRSVTILERMWNEYCSGHLNTVAEECLDTDRVKKEAGVDTIKLKTTILEKDYMKCKKFLTELSGKLSIQGGVPKDKIDGCQSGRSVFR